MKSPTPQRPWHGSEPPYARKKSEPMRPWPQALAPDIRNDNHNGDDPTTDTIPDASDSVSVSSSALDLLASSPAPTIPDDIGDDGRDEHSSGDGYREHSGAQDVDMDAGAGAQVENQAPVGVHEPAAAPTVADVPAQPGVAVTRSRSPQPVNLPRPRTRPRAPTKSASPPRLSPAQKGKGRAAALFLPSHSPSPVPVPSPRRKSQASTSRHTSRPVPPGPIYTVDDDSDDDAPRPVRSRKPTPFPQLEAHIKPERSDESEDDYIVPLPPPPRAMTDIVELSDSDGDGSDGHAWVPKYHDVRSFEALKVLGAHACRKIIGIHTRSAVKILRGSGVSEGRVSTWPDVAVFIGVGVDRVGWVKDYDSFISKAVDKGLSLKGIYLDLDEYEQL